MTQSLKTGKILFNKLQLTNYESLITNFQLQIFTILILIIIPNFSNAEIIVEQGTSDSSIVNRFINEKARYFTVDKLGQSYIVNEVEELIKYDANGEQLFTYFDRTFGQISYIDVTNPFQIAVFYEGFQTIVWLDRTLNPISSVNLSRFGFFQINILGVSSDNHLWIYDNATFQIKKINTKGEVMVESVELNNQFPTLNPTSIVEKNNRIYLNNPETGILIFDNFGQFIQTLPIPNLTNFQIFNNQLFYQKNKKVYRFQLKTLIHQAVKLPFDIDANETVVIQKNFWFWVKSEEIVIGDL
jgi:hypothetical protein